jgi:hypothetical protein
MISTRSGCQTHWADPADIARQGAPLLRPQQLFIERRRPVKREDLADEAAFVISVVDHDPADRDVGADEIESAQGAGGTWR